MAADFWRTGLILRYIKEVLMGFARCADYPTITSLMEKATC